MSVTGFNSKWCLCQGPVCKAKCTTGHVRPEKGGGRSLPGAKRGEGLLDKGHQTVPRDEVVLLLTTGDSEVGCSEEGSGDGSLVCEKQRNKGEWIWKLNKTTPGL